jgi:hypothetical protein
VYEKKIKFSFFIKTNIYLCGTKKQKNEACSKQLVVADLIRKNPEVR